jgi:hypothetical protein
MDILTNLKKNFLIESGDVLTILSTKDDYDSSILHEILFNSTSDEKTLEALLNFFTYLKITFDFNYESLGLLFSVQGPSQVTLIRSLISNLSNNENDVVFALLVGLFTYLKNLYCFPSDSILDVLISRDGRNNNIIDEIDKIFAHNSKLLKDLQEFFTVEFDIDLEKENLKWTNISKNYAKKWITKAKNNATFKKKAVFHDSAVPNLPIKNIERNLEENFEQDFENTYENVEFKFDEMKILKFEYEHNVKHEHYDDGEHYYSKAD